MLIAMHLHEHAFLLTRVKRASDVQFQDQTKTRSKESRSFCPHRRNSFLVDFTVCISSPIRKKSILREGCRGKIRPLGPRWVPPQPRCLPPMGRVPAKTQEGNDDGARSRRVHPPRFASQDGVTKRRKEEKRACATLEAETWTWLAQPRASSSNRRGLPPRDVAFADVAPGVGKRGNSDQAGTKWSTGKQRTDHQSTETILCNADD